MQIPEIIFAIIVLITIVAFFILKKKKKLRFTQIIIGLLLLVFSYIWFIPIHIGYIGEAAICKFRFQVFWCDGHDYGGYGDMSDIFIKPMPQKYGRSFFYKRLGGWQEYFGLKNIDEKKYQFRYQNEGIFNKL